jgi:general secretion pathway protein E
VRAIQPDLALGDVPGADASELTLVARASAAGASPEVQARAAAEVLGVPFDDDLARHAPSALFAERVPIDFARQHGVIGLAVNADNPPSAIRDPQSLPVALASLAAWPQLDVLGRFLDRPIAPRFAPIEQVRAAINRAYQEREGQAQALIDTLDQREVLAEVGQLEGREDLLDVAGRAPVIKLVNLMIFEAVKGRASDVHVQPYEDRLVVRMRIDGLLCDAFDVAKGLQDEVVSRIKVLGRMNIAEKRLPQDGRSTVQVGDRLVDLRIASLPTSFGERVVIRLLDKTTRLHSLESLGMDPATFARFRELARLEHGLILVTGPTGSGKSTTLYSVLQGIDAKQHNVVTLEDPIEYQLDGVSQTQVSEKKGMTFAAGLRSVLRQDPDVIMVGEIRDQETAVMAIQSALTGHLVFSTLHTNDAASAVTRLLDLGIESYLLASSLVAVLAQRLVRKVCPHCADEYMPTADELNRLGPSVAELARGRDVAELARARGDSATAHSSPLTTHLSTTHYSPLTSHHPSFRRGRGCPACRQTGFFGRLGIFELLVVDNAIRAQIQAHANASQIRDAAVARGMRLFRDDGIAKVFDGTTTIDEVVRITMRSA